MKSLSILIILFIGFLFGCQSSNKNEIVDQEKRQCDCPVENLPEEKIYSDSTVTKVLEDDLFDWSIGGKINSKIRKVIDAEVQANLSSSEDSYAISTKKVLERISNDSPQLINKAYSFKLSRVFYCAYYSRLDVANVNSVS
ncbi:MAG: hypothetical protein R2828_25635 [Saprospiraceae bacterium]